MAAFVGGTICFTGCSDEKKTKTKKTKKEEINLSSRKATATTFVKAIHDGDTETMWECFSLRTQRILKEIAASRNLSIKEFKQEFCNDMRNQYEADGKSINQSVEDLLRDPRIFSKVDGKWYINVARDIKRTTHYSNDYYYSYQ